MLPTWAWLCLFGSALAGGFCWRKGSGEGRFIIIFLYISLIPMMKEVLFALDWQEKNVMVVAGTVAIIFSLLLWVCVVYGNLIWKLQELLDGGWKFNYKNMDKDIEMLGVMFLLGIVVAWISLPSVAAWPLLFLLALGGVGSLVLERVKEIKILPHAQEE